MKQTFEDYLIEARRNFAKVASEYTVDEHLKLRTAIDTFMIAYDQSVSKALTTYSMELINQCETFFCNDERSKEGKCPEQCGVCSEYASI
jgi:hypothetical protein